MTTTHLELAIDIAAPVDRVWAAITDWPTQGRWMLGTTVEVTGGDGRSAGSTLAAFTGARAAGIPLGFLDTMTITTWQPPHRCDVVHTGRLVRGTGTMLVEANGPQSSRFTWIEDLDLPLGALGRLGFPVVRPAFVAGVRASLAAFARLVESGDLPAPSGAAAPGSPVDGAATR